MSHERYMALSVRVSAILPAHLKSEYVKFIAQKERMEEEIGYRLEFDEPASGTADTIKVVLHVVGLDELGKLCGVISRELHKGISGNNSIHIRFMGLPQEGR